MPDWQRCSSPRMQPLRGKADKRLWNADERRCSADERKRIGVISGYVKRSYGTTRCRSAFICVLLSVFICVPRFSFAASHDLPSDDPFRYLEDRNDPRTQEFFKAQ